MEYQIEKLTDKNIEDLLPIYQSAFSTDIELSELKAKFDTSSFGLKNVGFIAYSPEGEASAFYGVFPCEVYFNGEKILIAQSGDTMTHKNHRRKNLFVKLAEKTFDFCRENDISLVYGFPNELSYMGFIKKLKWSHKENISAYHLRCKCLPFIRMKSVFPFLKSFFDKIKRNKFEKIQVKGKPFESNLLEQGQVGVLRDQKFINYKSYSKKYFLLIHGVQVWVKPNEMFLLVGDVSICSDEKFYLILKQLKKICFRIGIPHLRFHTSPGTKLERLLKPISKKYDIEYPIGYLKFNDKLDINKLKYSLADYDTF
tara:strand:- start:6420 stop:7358 length:939 start_codon:yes stop_codon:yes gene_type:complete